MKKLILGLFSFVFFYATQALPADALSMGGLKVQSAMGQTFRGTISILGVSEDDFEVVQRSISYFDDTQNTDFNSLSLAKYYSRVPQLPLNITLKKVSPGSWDVLLSTTNYANEPSYVFWLELRDGKHTLTRLYTVALPLSDTDHHPLPHFEDNTHPKRR